MNIDERIARRRREDAVTRLIRDYDALSPVAHVAEPTGRGPVLEEVLDLLDPAFDGRLPPNGYVWGPKGGGKSAVVTALFDRLAVRSRRSQSVIHTSTRAHTSPDTDFVYVDARRADTDFAFYRAVLDELVESAVPTQGIGTEQVRRRLGTELGHDRHAVVAVDHVGDPETHGVDGVATLCEAVDAPVSWLAVGRRPPADLDAAPDATVAVAAYERHAMVDVLTDRATTGLTRHALSHDEVRAVAEWADGDAHDALAAVFGAAAVAVAAGRDAIELADADAGMEEVPPRCISLGRVLALSDSRRRVLRELVELPPVRRDSVAAATEAIAAAEGVELSPTTVKRLLYELAESGVIRRVRAENESNRRQGRPPSRLEPRFPTRVFARLHALAAEG